MNMTTSPETRGRSRSKTPFLRSSCDRELCSQLTEEHLHERKLKKSPQVQTIIEEAYEQSIPSLYNKFNSMQTESKNVTSDYSSDDVSPELGRSRSNMKTVSITTMTETITKGGQSSSFRTASAHATQISPPSEQLKSKELSQNEINTAFEISQIQTSTPITVGNSARSTIVTSSTKNGQPADHISYKEYHAAGEYWNKYPKTDYTYSHLSPHRRELAPGVIAMPNMSRNSLEKHHERINIMIQQNPKEESFIRQRYENSRHTNTSVSKKFLRKEMQYDSQDEVDLTEFETLKKGRRYLQYNINTARKESVITRVITALVVLFNRITSVFWINEDNLYYTRQHEKKGFFSRTTSAISSFILSIFRPLYMLISSVLYLDTWLLRSSASDSRGKKRFLLILLLCLPLLLLAGTQYYLNPNYVFPPFVIITSYKIPINFDDFKSNTIEKFDAFKTNTIDDLKSFTEDYFIYLKSMSQNLILEAQKIWIDTFNSH